MTLIQLVFDLTFLFLSYLATLFIRTHLPFGEPVSNLPRVTLDIYISLAGIWALSAIGLRRIFEKAKNVHKQLTVFSAICFFSIIEYLVIQSINPSFSRLFLPFFLSLNLLALAISRNTKPQQQAVSSGLQNLFKTMALIYSKMNERLRHYYAEIVFALVASFLWANYIIKMGLTLTTDSITYLESALELSVNGELALSTHWPPLYPIIISFTKIFTTFPADGAAIISALSVFIFFFFFALLLREYSRSALINILLIILLASLDEFVSIFRTALSEQLYSVFLIVSFYLLVRHQKNHDYIYFLGAVLLAGLGAITRYIGVSMGLILVLYTLIFNMPMLSLEKRIRKYTAIACLSFLPFLTLVAWNYSNRGSGIGYALKFFSIFVTTRETLALLWANIGRSYLIPLFVLLGFAIVTVFRNRRADTNLLLLSTVFPVSYLGLTIGAFVVTVAHPQTRYFSPLYFFILLAIAHLVDKIQTSDFAKSRPLTELRRLVLGFVAVVFLFTSSVQLAQAENVLVDRVRSSRNNSLEQRVEGFDLSPTAHQLAGFFRRISGEDSDLIVFVIEGDYDMRTMVFETDYKLWTPFFFRSSIFRLAGFDRLVFVAAADERQILHFSYEGRPKELTFLLPKPDSLNELVGQLTKSSIVNTNKGNIYFIINEFWYENFAEGFFGNNLQAIELTDTADPYLIFQLTPNH